MKKAIFILAAIVLLFASCARTIQTISEPTSINAVYMVEEKSMSPSLGGSAYSLKVSKVNNPKELHSVTMGRLTWKTLKAGDYLDYNYRKVK